jgi:hypothetical protein
MEGLGFSLQKQAELETLTLDVLKSSEIEGENLNVDQMEIAGSIPADRDVEGVVEMTLDATQNFNEPLKKSACVAGMPRCFRQVAVVCARSLLVRGATMPTAQCRLFLVRSRRREFITRRQRPLFYGERWPYFSTWQTSQKAGLTRFSELRWLISGL